MNTVDPSGMCGSSVDELTAAVVPSKDDCVALITQLNNLLGSGHNPARVKQWQELYQANKAALAVCRKRYGLVPKKPQSRPNNYSETPSWWPHWLPPPTLS